MRQTERYDNLEESIRSAFDGLLRGGLWTSLPAIVESYDPGDNTVSARPAITAGIRQRDGSVAQTPLPLLIKVPVKWPAGGGYCATFPLAAGDEVIVVFATRAIDSWWQQGGVQPPVENRTHDLSDGMALPCVFSTGRVPANISTSAAQLRTNDGSNLLEINSNGTVTIRATNALRIDTPVVQSTGVWEVLNEGSIAHAVTINGSVVATDVISVNNNNTLSTHVHPAPGGDTSPPVANT